MQQENGAGRLGQLCQRAIDKDMAMEDGMPSLKSMRPIYPLALVKYHIGQFQNEH
jgi:hypothetical protein